MLRRLHLGSAGVHQPCAGIVGRRDLEEGRTLYKVDFQCLGVSGGKGVALDLVE